MDDKSIKIRFTEPVGLESGKIFPCCHVEKDIEKKRRGNPVVEYVLSVEINDFLTLAFVSPCILLSETADFQSHPE